MPENNNENSGQKTQQDNVSEGNQRSEKRYQDLSKKVSDLAQEKTDMAQKHETEKAELLKGKQEAEFKANLLELSSKYPAAKEFEADIKTKAMSGYSLEDAIISTLASKGKFAPTETIKQDIKSQAMGGSADVTIREVRRDDPTFGGDSAKMREELVRLENEGQIKLTG